jgi:hypothetical protein
MHRPSVLLIGDSHADHFAAGLGAYLASRNLSARVLTRSRCPPLIDARTFERGTVRRLCDSYSRAIAEFLSQDRDIQLVVIAARWDYYTADTPSEALDKLIYRLGDAQSPVPGDAAASKQVLERSLRRMIESLVAAGKQVVLLGQIPPYATSPMACMVRIRQAHGAERDCFAPMREVRRHLDYSNDLLKSLADPSNGVDAFLPSEVLCDPELCSPFMNGVFLYRDDDHLSATGSKQFAAYLGRIPALANLRAR